MAGAIKVLFVIPSLGGGGAERAGVNLLKHLDRSRFDLSLGLFNREGPYLSDVPADVAVHDLRGRSSRDPRLIWRLAQLLRRIQPNVVFSIMRRTNVITLLGARLAGHEPKIVINEQNCLQAEFAMHGWGRAKGALVRWLYPRADVVTVTSRGIKEELTRDFGLPGSKVVVVYNSVDVVTVQSLGSVPVDHPWFNGEVPVVIAAGRLHPQKGFEYLIRAFQRIGPATAARLVILGEGPSRRDLEKLIAGLHLEEYVALPGFQQNPYHLMARATVFVLSSLYEGFGNVIAEAMALGVPVVATRCPSGPAEIIEDGVDGTLVPVADEAALGEAILQVLADKDLAARLRQRGPERAREFDAGRIAAQYASIFDSLCAS